MIPMQRTPRFILVALLLLVAAAPRKSEKPVDFVAAKPDPTTGDWQAPTGMVAQVVATGSDGYTAYLLKAFDAADSAVAVLRGQGSTDGVVTFNGDGGWTGTIRKGQFDLRKGDERFNLKPVSRTSPTAGAKPPPGAVVLFDGRDLNAWAKKAGKDWLSEDGPARWKLVDGGAVEVVPDSDCIITHQKFGDCKLHVEFRTLGSPTNSGVFLQDRYEININETYGRQDGTPAGGLDNCTDKSPPKVRPAFPPLAWQMFDVDFHAPRFDASGKKTANARATVVFNGVKIYDDQELDAPRGAAAKLGEAPAGPLMLQDHGMPVQFRNMWIVETGKTSRTAG
jgi:hypothetical protein